MLRWILALSILCFASAVVALGYIVPITYGLQNGLLTLTALTATLLISSFDAFETQSSRIDDEDN